MEIRKDIFISIREVILQARNNTFNFINSQMVFAYWQIGKIIIDEEQNGQKRAEYGKFLLKELAQILSNEFGKGFDERELRRIRQFYTCFPIRDTVRPELTWPHYRLNIKVSNINWKKNTLQELENYMAKRQVELSRFNRKGLYKMKQFYESYINAHFVFTIANKLQIREGKINKFVLSLLIQIKWSVAKLNNFLTQLKYLN